MNESVNEMVYIAHIKLLHKTLRFHSDRYIQCIHETEADRDRDRNRDREF